MPSIYIINPAADRPNYHSFEVLDGPDGGWVQVADLTIVTLAAFVPPHWTIRLTDEAISPVDMDAEVDFVAITGKVTQLGRMIALADGFRAAGRTVLIGGPLATLSPDHLRDHADIFVTGEIEELAPRLFAELEDGTWQQSYDGGRADITLSPLPRWDLYPVDRAQFGALQTTRGCPFSCEFCDVIQYQGRKQRHKHIEQILRELDRLYEAGFRGIFLVDDNFTVHRAWARQVLEALATWNGAQETPVTFVTQASLDIARDGDMLKLCRAAGLTMLFMGIETINEASLREAGKRQNLLLPLLDAVDRIVSSGIGIHAGIIVGFDHDGPETFEDLRRFFAAAPLPNLGIGVLTAPEATDLYRRLQREGRLALSSTSGNALSPFVTNIVPAKMTQEALIAETIALAQWAYSPEEFGRRLLIYIARFPDTAERRVRHSRSVAARPRQDAFGRLLRHVSSLGPAEGAMVQAVLLAAGKKRLALPSVLYYLSHYAQARYFLTEGRAGCAAAVNLPYDGTPPFGGVDCDSATGADGHSL